MEDTESSDFLSSSGSFYSSFSAGSASNLQEDPGDVRFDVFLSDGLTEAAKTAEGYESVRMIPNSRLSSADHPVLIRLENEYQARRSPWYRHAEQYCSYPPETERRTPNKNKRPSSQLSGADHPVLVRLEDEYQARRAVWHAGQYCRYTPEKEGRAGSCPSKNKPVSRGSPARKGYRDKPLMDLTFPDETDLQNPQPKRQRNPDGRSPSHWWRDKKGPDLPLSNGDRVFAQKCWELQGFIKPLTELLNGLKRGKYDRGLSSFQQSLAMDRIQRIVGVLQKPEMGERYLSTLLQVEMMLKVWFPGVTSSSSDSSFSSSSDLDTEEPQSKMAKHPDVQNVQAQPPPCLNRPPRGGPPESLSAASAHSDCVCCKDGVQVLAEWPTMNLTWMHTSPICNPPLSLNTVFGQDVFGGGGSSCGIIFLVQNGQASTTPAAVSSGSEERPLDGARRHCPARSQSAPPINVLSDGSALGKLKSQSHSLSHLSACLQTSGGEKT